MPASPLYAVAFVVHRGWRCIVRQLRLRLRVLFSYGVARSVPHEPVGAWMRLACADGVAMSAPRWMIDAVAASETLSLDNEGDRLTLLQRLVDARARCCRLCDQDLTGKTNRTHFTTPDGTKPCLGSWL